MDRIHSVVSKVDNTGEGNTGGHNSFSGKVLCK